MIANRSVPASSVIPVLAYPDVAATSDWLCLHPTTDYAYGERQHTAEDPGGHRWTFSPSIADVDPASWGSTSINIG